MASKSKKNTADTPTGLNTAIVPAIAIFLLHILTFAIPGSRLWGFNHLLFLPPDSIAICLAFGLLALALLNPAVRRVGVKSYSGLAEIMFASASPLRWIVTAIFSAAFFWLLRMPIHFLGDGYNVVQNIGNDIPVIVKWSETGATWVIRIVADLLPLTGMERGDYAYAIVSVVSGLFTVFIFALLAHQLGKDAVGKLFIFGSLLFSGWTLLFFGYAENYPILWPFVTAYLYFAIKYLQEGKGFRAATIMLAVACILHVQIIFWGISYLYLLFSHGKAATFYRNHKRLIWLSLLVIVVVGIYLFIQRYQQSLSFRLKFMTLFKGRPNTPDYFLFSPKHLLDIFNLASLLIPLWPAMIIPVLGRLRQSGLNRIDRFLMIFSVGGLGLLLAIDPKLGMARDWDLFALTALGPMLFMIKNFTRIAVARRIYPFMAVLSLAMVLPYFVVNLTEKPAIENYEFLLEMDKTQSRPGWIFIRDYYYLKGDSATGKAIDRKIWNQFPGARLARQATRLSREGKFDEAYRLADSLYRLNPYTIEALNTRGMVYLAGGYFREAIRDLELSASLGRYDPRALVNLGNAYYQTAQFDKMLECMRKAQKLNPRAIEVVQGLTMGFYAMNKFDSALAYGHFLMEIDPTVPHGYLGLGLTYYKLGDYDKSIRYLLRYVEIGPPGYDYDLSLKLLKEMTGDEE